MSDDTRFTWILVQACVFTFAMQRHFQATPRVTAVVLLALIAVFARLDAGKERL